MTELRLLGLYVFAKDLDATLAFYHRVGLEVDRISDAFARATMPGGGVIEFGTDQLTHSYDPDWTRPDGNSNNTINLELPSRDAVDSTYADLVHHGYTGHLAPCDPLWQARFAILIDPDGNFVGLHSPRNLAEDQAREATQ